MKIGNLLLWGGAAFLLWNIGSVARAANVLSINLVGIRMIDFLTYQFNVGIQNVSNANITINSLAGDVYIGDTYLGNLSQFSGSASVPANSQTVYPVYLSLSGLSLPSAIRNALNDYQNLQFTLKGNVNATVNGINTIIPFNTDLEFAI